MTGNQLQVAPSKYAVVVKYLKPKENCLGEVKLGVCEEKIVVDLDSGTYEGAIEGVSVSASKGRAEVMGFGYKLVIESGLIAAYIGSSKLSERGVFGAFIDGNKWLVIEPTRDFADKIAEAIRSFYQENLAAWDCQLFKQVIPADYLTYAVDAVLKLVENGFLWRIAVCDLPEWGTSCYLLSTTPNLIELTERCKERGLCRDALVELSYCLNEPKIRKLLGE